jgi:hypothetical protein
LISVLPQVNDQSIAAGRTMTFSRHERGDREQTNDPVFRNVLLMHFSGDWPSGKK